MTRVAAGRFVSLLRGSLESWKVAWCAGDHRVLVSSWLGERQPKSSENDQRNLAEFLCVCWDGWVFHGDLWGRIRLSEAMASATDELQAQLQVDRYLATLRDRNKTGWQKVLDQLGIYRYDQVWTTRQARREWEIIIIKCGRAVFREQCFSVNRIFFSWFALRLSENFTFTRPFFYYFIFLVLKSHKVLSNNLPPLCGVVLLSFWLPWSCYTLRGVRRISAHIYLGSCSHGTLSRVWPNACYE